MIIEVVEGDVRSTPLDVLILKFADSHRGADLAVAMAMGSRPLGAPLGQHRFFSTNNRIEAKEVLVLGVGPLHDFDYKKISRFAQSALEVVTRERPSARRIGITIHGPGYGLDELASIASLVEGMVGALLKDHSVDGIGSGDFRILIIESSSRRAKRIREYLNSAGKDRPSLEPGQAEVFSKAAADAVSSNGTYAKRLFAAMPFKLEYLDHSDLALQPAAHENGLLIERLDHEHFTGDIVAEIRNRIEKATAVVAVLDEFNPNVFLEVGYAWGRDRPAILLLKEGQEAPFDVRGQKLLRYNRLGHLKSSLSTELRGLLSGMTI